MTLVLGGRRMLLSKVRHTENTPDTEKTFTFMLGLDETEKSPGSKWK